MYCFICTVVLQLGDDRRDVFNLLLNEEKPFFEGEDWVDEDFIGIYSHGVIECRMWEEVS